MRSSFFKFSVRDIVEIAVLCALAVVLDKFVRIPTGITGGSINICTVPLFIIAFRHGWFKGFIGAGLVFGVTSCIIDGYGFQYFLFDYLFAFGSIAIGGLFGIIIFKNFCKKGALGKVFAIILVIVCVGIFCVLRTLSASVDSMIFYDYTLWASIVYNISYIGPSCIGVAIALPLLLPVFNTINKIYPTSYLRDALDDEEEDEETKVHFKTH